MKNLVGINLEKELIEIEHSRLNKQGDSLMLVKPNK